MSWFNVIPRIAVSGITHLDRERMEGGSERGSGWMEGASERNG